MGDRKRSKPNPKAESEQPSWPTSQDREQQQVAAKTLHSKETLEQVGNTPTPAADDTSRSTRNGPSTPQSTTSWYGRAWPSTTKSAPVTKVAKESITSAGSAAGKWVANADPLAGASSPQPPSISSPLRSPTSYLSRGSASSTRSLPLVAAPTKLNVISSANETQSGTAEEGLRRQSNNTSTGEIKPQPDGNGEVKDKELAKSARQNGQLYSEPPSTLYSQRPPEEAGSTNESAKWLAWFTRVGNMGPSGPNRPQIIVSPESLELPPSPNQRRNSEPNLSSPPSQPAEPPRSWLGIWGSTVKETMVPSASATEISTVSTGSDEQSLDKNATVIPDASQPSVDLAETTKSYGWAFWSRDDSRDPAGKRRRPSNVGELAFAGSASQSKPENAVVDESKGIPNRVSKRPRPQSMQDLDETSKAADVKAQPKPAAQCSAIPELPKTDASTGVKAKKQPKNLVLPSFRNTYRNASRPGLIQQLGRFFQLGTSSELKHVEISNPRQVTRALAIGVHGYFPAPLIRSVLGQPTGTSIRFANSAASAIQKWCQDQGYSCDVEKVALEGEGKISERIDLLWKLMLNWIDKIRKADFVMIACHSQGVPVAMMLVAKLIAFGCVNSARIGVCAMAGVNMGPFADYKSRWISGSAGELFEFCLPDSRVSKDYEAALDTALRFGVRVVYIGSIDDQLVSLESSTFSTLSHPYVYRAVFVDGRVHAPDFLTHLVGFALKLRNLGVSDHGLIRELSSPLAGSLYGGEGHSRIYDDESVYSLAVEHALETTSVGNVPMQISRAGTPTGQNPYILPFAMRGVLEEEYVRTELYGEITELIRQFDDWKPQKTVLKDVKFRLEGVRSKL